MNGPGTLSRGEAVGPPRETFQGLLPEVRYMNRAHTSPAGATRRPGRGGVQSAPNAAAVNVTRIAPLLLLSTGCGTPTPFLPPGGSTPGAAALPAEEGDVVVARLSGRVEVQAPNERAPIPIPSGGNRAVRVPPGTAVVVAPGGRALLTFPDGSDLMIVDDATLDVLDPSRGPLVRVSSVRFLSVDLRGQASLELPGGAVAEGNGSRFVVRRIRDRLLRFETRGGSPATLRLGGVGLVLEAGRFAEVPVTGVPGGVGGAH